MLRALQYTYRYSAAHPRSATAAVATPCRNYAWRQSTRHPSSLSSTCITRRCLTTTSGGNNNNGDEDKKPSTNKPPNFDRKILQPAQRGQLNKKHGSAIPRLAARRAKAHLTPVSGRAGHRGPPTDEMIEGDVQPNAEGIVPYGEGTGEGGFKQRQQKAMNDSIRYIMEDYDPYFALELHDDKKYYWREEEFEKLVDDGFDESMFFGPDGNDAFEVEFTKQDLAQRPMLDSSMAEELENLRREMDAHGGVMQNMSWEDADDDDEDDEAMEDDREGRQDRAFKYDGMDPEEWYFDGSSDIIEALGRDDLPEKNDSFGPPPEIRKEVVELAPHGTGVDGFVQAMIDHPTDYARFSMLKQHPAGQREPMPDFPKNRQPHPPLEFVEGHNRFLYVTGLPTLTLNGEEGDLNNPVHRSFLEKLVARLVNVDSTQVWPVNRTSAFVGFFTPRSMAEALKAGPTERVLSMLPHVTLLSRVEDAKNPFSDTEADRVVQLSHMPSGHSPSSLLRTLFPPDSELETVYGSHLDASKDVYFLSSTKVLLRFSSAEEALSAISSSLWEERLEDVGLYPVRFFRARRELIHGGFTGPVKDDEVRVMGPRLVVDGDMPSKEFFLSHPRCVHVRNLDPVSTTPEILTELFQPYCEMPRQLGSIEQVTCEDGVPTDRAYVGFDLPGEAEACVKACNGLIKIGDRKINVRLVDDRRIPHQPLYRAEKRPARSAEELWDDLHNWEKFVDPADIEYLEQNGVSKVIIDEALRRIRRSNPTFGPLDNALRSEALKPETSPGQLYEELVVLYIQTLKECVATPDNVGPMYEALHMPNEPIDLSIFDEWEKKKAAIEQSRARPS